MSTRLQVILDDREMADIRRTAKRERLTVAEWVRRALRTARQRVPASTADKKVQVIRAAAKHSFPTGDIDQMLSEIEAGYSAGAQP